MRQTGQTTSSLRRGRPRQYDRAQALGRAIETFHRRGFSGTSLDDLAAATGMNRPSLYNAFGNKQALYREALKEFTTRLSRTLEELLFDEPDLSRALDGFYSAALDEYFARKTAHGCFVFCTAPAEAAAHPEVAADVRAVLAEVDRTLARRFERARHDRQIPPTTDSTQAGKLAQAVLHSIALRARAGESRRSLARFARLAVQSLCPPGPGHVTPPRRAKRA